MAETWQICSLFSALFPLCFQCLKNDPKGVCPGRPLAAKCPTSLKQIPSSRHCEQLLQSSTEILLTCHPKTPETAILFERGDEFLQPPFFEKLSLFLWTASLFACLSPHYIEAFFSHIYANTLLSFLLFLFTEPNKVFCIILFL